MQLSWCFEARTGAALPEGLSDGEVREQGNDVSSSQERSLLRKCVLHVRLQHVRSGYLRDGYNLRNDLRHTEDRSLCCRSLCALRFAAVTRS